MVRLDFIDEVTSEQINMGVAHANTCRQSVVGCLRDSTGPLVAKCSKREFSEVLTDVLGGGGRS